MAMPAAVGVAHASEVADGAVDADGAVIVV